MGESLVNSDEPPLGFNVPNNTVCIQVPVEKPEFEFELPSKPINTISASFASTPSTFVDEEGFTLVSKRPKIKNLIH